jgi:hypothetical protein
MSNDPKKFKTGIAVTGTASVGGDTITTNTAAQSLVNKTIDADSNTISNIDNADIKAGAAIDASKIHDGSVSNTEFGYLNGVTSAIQTQLNDKADTADLADYILLTEKGANNGVATLDGGGKVPVAQLPSAVMTYEGVWNASTNSPSLADGVGDAGQVYRVSVAGSQDLGSGSISFSVGDYVIYNGTVWEKSDTTDAVASVNGQTGIVSLDSDDISEGVTNLYHTDERAQDAIGTILVDSSKIDLTYNDATPSITADIVPGSLVNADINASAAIDATKIADGSVSNTEFQYINSLTSNAQTQLNETLLKDGSRSLNNNVFLKGRNSADSADVNIIRVNSSDNIQFRSGGTIDFNGGGVINTSDLTPDSDLTRVLGSGSNRYNFINVANVTSSGSPLTLYTNASNANIILDPHGTGSVNVSSSKIINVSDPTNDQDAATKAYVDSVAGSSGSAGDIDETSFSLANNQASAANVTGLAFANATVRSFKALVSVEIDATADLYEVFELVGVQRGADWSMSQSSNGDDSQVVFSITTAGQVQYTSASYAGFVSGAAKFRAITTSI